MSEFRYSDTIPDRDFGRVAALLAQAPWSPGISREEVTFAAQNSALVVAAYRGEDLVGYLRVISDRTRFAYLVDVIVDPAWRGNGVFTGMLEYAITHPRLELVYQWLSWAEEAYGMYEQVGFRRLDGPEQWAMRYAPRPPR